VHVLVIIVNIDNMHGETLKIWNINLLNIKQVFLGVHCWWCSWLRHCATSRKVAGSIPDGVK